MFSADDLQRVAQRHLSGASEAKFEPIRTGLFNTSYFARAGDREYVLRVAPSRDAVFCFYERGMMRQEPGLHALLRERTSVPVAEVMAFDDSLEILPRDYILMERLPGRPLTEAAAVDMNAVLRRTGECLAEVHRIEAEQYGYLGEHKPMEPQARWADAFHIMWNRLIDDIVAVGYYNDKESGLMRRLLDQHIHLFERTVRSSLLHMDVWGENILVDDAGVVTGLIDWDRALWGDVEIEFAVLDYCGISQPAFWEGYGQQRDFSGEASGRNVFYLLYELQKYIVIRGGRNNDPASADRYKDQVMQVLRQAFG